MQRTASEILFNCGVALEDTVLNRSVIMSWFVFAVIAKPEVLRACFCSF